MDAGRITALSAVPDDSTVLFRVADESGDEQEAILVADGTAATDGGEPTAASDDGVEPTAASDDGVACWLNYCQHLTHIKLDKGSVLHKAA
jgi:hypothetical protein